ncbi:MAG: hypothetical protein LKI94_03605 [Sporolactobacillus sp.]|jgi:hypothetical protein|nr:hypothetical protein [Sporolactobacillus sp.]
MSRSKRIGGGIFLLLAVGFFSLQIGYFFVHRQLGIDYYDKRYFYLVNNLCICSLALAVMFLLTLPKKIQFCLAGLAALFIVISGMLVAGVGRSENLITSLSPDRQHLLVLKKDRRSGRAVYYRPAGPIFVRAKGVLLGRPEKTLKVKWLATDIAAITYRTTDNRLRQYIATYGERGDGGYYHVAAQIQGRWRAGSTTVISDTNGITVTMGEKRELFKWTQIDQFGTLAVVLHQANQAVWTIALDDDFTVHAAASKPAGGTIRLYRATTAKNRPLTLHRVSAW